MRPGGIQWERTMSDKWWAGCSMVGTMLSGAQKADICPVVIMRPPNRLQEKHPEALERNQWAWTKSSGSRSWVSFFFMFRSSTTSSIPLHFIFLEPKHLKKFVNFYIFIYLFLVGILSQSYDLHSLIHGLLMFEADVVDFLFDSMLTWTGLTHLPFLGRWWGFDRRNAILSVSEELHIQATHVRLYLCSTFSRIQAPWSLTKCSSWIFSVEEKSRK